MMSCARSTASFLFSFEQFGESPIRLSELTICGTNCAALEKKRFGWRTTSCQMCMSCGSEWPSSTMIFFVHFIHVG
eukprot:3850819-Pleurochrysis_carterae.AAC.1